MRQHLACWPPSAHPSMNWLMLVGLVVAGNMLVIKSFCGGWGNRTRSAVQVGEVQDVGSAADGVAGRAETNLALIEGSSEGGGGGESENGGDGELHFEGWLNWLVLGKEEGSGSKWCC
jgi:hypothetical protein